MKDLRRAESDSPGEDRTVCSARPRHDVGSRRGGTERERPARGRAFAFINRIFPGLVDSGLALNQDVPLRHATARSLIGADAVVDLGTFVAIQYFVGSMAKARRFVVAVADGLRA